MSNAEVIQAQHQAITDRGLNPYELQATVLMAMDAILEDCDLALAVETLTELNARIDRAIADLKAVGL